MPSHIAQILAERHRGREPVVETKQVVETVTDPDGKKYRVVKTVQVTRRFVHKSVIERRGWAKFGACRDLPPGPESGTYLSSVNSQTNVPGITGIDDPVVIEPPQKAEKPVHVPTAATQDAAPKPVQITCRNCGQEGHWTSKCPNKKVITQQGGDRPELPKREEYTIRVTNLSEDAQEDDLRDLFQPFGRVDRVFVAKHRESGKAKGFAFVTYAVKTDAERAMKALQHYGYDHLILSLEWAKPSRS
ncbi:Eukaryotic translation initiation factor 3 subunit G-2 [Pelomyxa schiedti]|nr:Eukaryotic translation initiation factor 3 subunit G-2 [Pelomyxa schiedti]